MTTIRCKFRCTEISIIEGWDGTKRAQVYRARFVPVTSGSPENEAFYAATPAGSFDLQPIKEMPFTVGGEYFLDMVPAG